MSFDRPRPAPRHSDAPAPHTRQVSLLRALPARRSFVRSYRAVARSVGQARRDAEQVVSAWGLPTRTAQDVGLVVSELATNAHTHAYNARSEAQFKLSVSAERDGVRIEVWDTSPAHPQRKHPHQEDEEGRGLAIVEALASSYGSHPHKEGKAVFAIIPS